MRHKLNLLETFLLVFVAGSGIGSGLWLAVTGTSYWGYVLMTGSLIFLAWLSARLIETGDME